MKRTNTKSIWVKDDETPSSSRPLTATGEDGPPKLRAQRLYRKNDTQKVDVSVKPQGLQSWEASIELKTTELRRWGTWNVRGLTPEKLVIVEKGTGRLGQLQTRTTNSDRVTDKLGQNELQTRTNVIFKLYR
jgi:hypothetical protein